MLRKVSTVILAIVLCLIMATPAGCAKDDASMFANVKSEKGVIKLLLKDNEDTADDAIIEGLKKTVERFNKDNEGRYHCDILSNNADQTTINAFILSGECPDLFMCDSGESLKYYTEQNVAYDLTKIVTSDKEWYSKFKKGIFDNCIYDDKNKMTLLTDDKGNIKNGARIMAMPINCSCACVFFNKTLFKKAGIKEAPKTYDEFIKDCEKLEKVNIKPILTGSSVSMIAGYLLERECGPQALMSLVEGTSKWNDKTCLEAIKKLVELGKYSQKSDNVQEEEVAHFYNGEAAMLIQGSWEIEKINSSKKDFENEYGIVAFPDISKGSGGNRLISKTDNIVMSTQTKNKVACEVLLRYFTDDESQKYVAKEGKKIPVTNIKDNKELPKKVQDINKIFEETKGQEMFYDEAMLYKEAKKEFDNEMNSIYLGSKSPEDGLESLNKYFEKNIWKKK